MKNSRRILAHFHLEIVLQAETLRCLRLVGGFLGVERPRNGWGVAPNPTRGAASGLRKGLRPLTLSRDSVGDVCTLCPRADPSSVPPRLFFHIVAWEAKAKESRGRPQSPLALVDKTNIIGKGSRIPCTQSLARGILFFPPQRQKNALDSRESRANRNPAATYPPGPCPAKYFQHWRA